MTPQVSSRGTVKDPVHQFQNRLDAYKARLLKQYQKPEMDPQKLSKIKDIFESAGLSRQWMDMVDEL